MIFMHLSMEPPDCLTAWRGHLYGYEIFLRAQENRQLPISVYY